MLSDRTMFGATTRLPRVADVLERAAMIYPDTIEVLPSAHRSAVRCPFRGVTRLAGLMQSLHDLALNLQRRQGCLGESIHSALARSGYHYSPNVSPTAAGKYRSDYTFLVDGKPSLVGGHVTLGAGDANTCMSVHFVLDQHRVRIAWCGRHRPNTTS